jgi:hypothetical protein
MTDEQDFRLWWGASKYCQVVVPNRHWEQIARDAFIAGRANYLPDSLRDPMKVLERGKVLNLGVMGVSRAADAPNVLRVICRIEPTDDDMRALHDHISFRFKQNHHE